MNRCVLVCVLSVSGKHANVVLVYMADNGWFAADEMLLAPSADSLG